MEGSSITEGIGQGRITRNLEGLAVDFAYQIPDAETVETVFDLVKQDGLVLGSSSGINVAGAIRLARELGPGHTGRDGPLRLRDALRVAAVQSGVPAIEGAAGPGVARGRAAADPAGSDGAPLGLSNPSLGRSRTRETTRAPARRRRSP